MAATGAYRERERERSAGRDPQRHDRPQPARRAQRDRRSASTEQSADGELWRRVEQIVAAAPSVAALRMHGVGLIAAQRLRAQGRALPSELRRDERHAALRALAAPAVLQRARAAYDGRLVLIKGPEVAARYPLPSTRAFIDLDLLAQDAEAAWRALRAHGFLAIGEPARYEGIHHLQPLAWPGLPLAVELHREVNHASWLHAPATAALLDPGLLQPSATGVAGLCAPVPAAHALVLACHGWAHEPLRSLRHLIDVAAMLEHGESEELAGELARRFGLTRMWATTLAAVQRLLLLGNGRAPSLRLWARHLAGARERTVLETHLARWAAPLCGMERAHPMALAAASVAFVSAAAPRGPESWLDAWRRTAAAAADAFHPQSQHRHERDREQGRRA